MYRRKMITRLKICEKKIGHHAHLRENDHIIYLSGEHSHNENAAIFSCAQLITCEIMRRKDAQYNISLANSYFKTFSLQTFASLSFV